jgi:putative NADH-flavin reductase
VCNTALSRRKTIKTVALVLAVLLLSGCASQNRDTVSGPVKPTDTSHKDITIALLGATGMVGGFIITEALSQGYNIRALARSPQKLDSFNDQISIVKGDARELSTIDALLLGSDVVISAIGPVSKDKQAARMISSDTTKNLVQLMPEHNIDRYIAVSGAGVVAPGDDRNVTGWSMRQLALLTLNQTLKDKQSEYEILAESTLSWTIVRCPIIEAQPFASQPTASLITPSSYSLRAGELARFLLDQINSNEFVQKAPFLNSL